MSKLNRRLPIWIGGLLTLVGALFPTTLQWILYSGMIVLLSVGIHHFRSSRNSRQEQAFLRALHRREQGLQHDREEHERIYDQHRANYQQLLHTDLTELTADGLQQTLRSLERNKKELHYARHQQRLIYEHLKALQLTRKRFRHHQALATLQQAEEQSLEHYRQLNTALEHHREFLEYTATEMLDRQLEDLRASEPYDSLDWGELAELGVQPAGTSVIWKKDEFGLWQIAEL